MELGSSQDRGKALLLMAKCHILNGQSNGQSNGPANPTKMTTTQARRQRCRRQQDGGGGGGAAGGSEWEWCVQALQCLASASEHWAMAEDASGLAETWYLEARVCGSMPPTPATLARRERASADFLSVLG